MAVGFLETGCLSSLLELGVDQLCVNLVNVSGDGGCG
jgi:hypothetical protein